MVFLFSLVATHEASFEGLQKGTIDRPLTRFKKKKPRTLSGTGLLLVAHPSYKLDQ